MRSRIRIVRASGRRRGRIGHDAELHPAAHWSRHGDSTGQASDSWEAAQSVSGLNRGGMMYMTERTVERRAGGNDIRMGRLCEAYAGSSLHVSCPQRAGMGENREM